MSRDAYNFFSENGLLATKRFLAFQQTMSKGQFRAELFSSWASNGLFANKGLFSFNPFGSTSQAAENGGVSNSSDRADRQQSGRARSPLSKRRKPNLDDDDADITFVGEIPAPDIEGEINNFHQECRRTLTNQENEVLMIQHAEPLLKKIDEIARGFVTDKFKETAQIFVEDLFNYVWQLHISPNNEERWLDFLALCVSLTFKLVDTRIFDEQNFLRRAYLKIYCCCKDDKFQVLNVLLRVPSFVNTIITTLFAKFLSMYLTSPKGLYPKTAKNYMILILAHKKLAQMQTQPSGLQKNMEMKQLLGEQFPDVKVPLHAKQFIDDQYRRIQKDVSKFILSCPDSEMHLYENFMKFEKEKVNVDRSPAVEQSNSTVPQQSSSPKRKRIGNCKKHPHIDRHEWIRKYGRRDYAEVNIPDQPNKKRKETTKEPENEFNIMLIMPLPVTFERFHQLAEMHSASHTGGRNTNTVQHPNPSTSSVVSGPEKVSDSVPSCSTNTPAKTPSMNSTPKNDESCENIKPDLELLGTLMGDTSEPCTDPRDHTGFNIAAVQPGRLFMETSNPLIESLSGGDKRDGECFSNGFSSAHSSLPPETNSSLKGTKEEHSNTTNDDVQIVIDDLDQSLSDDDVKLIECTKPGEGEVYNLCSDSEDEENLFVLDCERTSASTSIVKILFERNKSCERTLNNIQLDSDDKITFNDALSNVQISNDSILHADKTNPQLCCDTKNNMTKSKDDEISVKSDCLEDQTIDDLVTDVLSTPVRSTLTMNYDIGKISIVPGVSGNCSNTGPRLSDNSNVMHTSPPILKTLPDLQAVSSSTSSPHEFYTSTENVPTTSRDRPIAPTSNVQIRTDFLSQDLNPPIQTKEPSTEDNTEVSSSTELIESTIKCKDSINNTTVSILSALVNPSDINYNVEQPAISAVGNDRLMSSQGSPDSSITLSGQIPSTEDNLSCDESALGSAPIVNSDVLILATPNDDPGREPINISTNNTDSGIVRPNISNNNAQQPIIKSDVSDDIETVDDLLKSPRGEDRCSERIANDIATDNIFSEIDVLVNENSSMILNTLVSRNDSLVCGTILSTSSEYDSDVSEQSTTPKVSVIINDSLADESAFLDLTSVDLTANETDLLNISFPDNPDCTECLDTLVNSEIARLTSVGLSSKDLPNDNLNNTNDQIQSVATILTEIGFSFDTSINTSTNLEPTEVVGNDSQKENLLAVDIESTPTISSEILPINSVNSDSPMNDSVEIRSSCNENATDNTSGNIECNDKPTDQATLGDDLTNTNYQTDHANIVINTSDEFKSDMCVQPCPSVVYDSNCRGEAKEVSKCNRDDAQEIIRSNEHKGNCSSLNEENTKNLVEQSRDTLETGVLDIQEKCPLNDPSCVDLSSRNLSAHTSDVPVAHNLECNENIKQPVIFDSNHACAQDFNVVASLQATTNDELNIVVPNTAQESIQISIEETASTQQLKLIDVIIDNSSNTIENSCTDTQVVHILRDKLPLLEDGLELSETSIKENDGQNCGSDKNSDLVMNLMYVEENIINENTVANISCSTVSNELASEMTDDFHEESRPDDLRSNVIIDNTYDMISNSVEVITKAPSCQENTDTFEEIVFSTQISDESTNAQIGLVTGESTNGVSENNCEHLLMEIEPEIQTDATTTNPLGENQNLDIKAPNEALNTTSLLETPTNHVEQPIADQLTVGLEQTITDEGTDDKQPSNFPISTSIFDVNFVDSNQMLSCNVPENDTNMSKEILSITIPPDVQHNQFQPIELADPIVEAVVQDTDDKQQYDQKSPNTSIPSTVLVNNTQITHETPNITSLPKVKTNDVNPIAEQISVESEPTNIEADNVEDTDNEHQTNIKSANIFDANRVDRNKLIPGALLKNGINIPNETQNGACGSEVQNIHLKPITEPLSVELEQTVTISIIVQNSDYKQQTNVLQSPNNSDANFDDTGKLIPSILITNDNTALANSDDVPMPSSLLLPESDDKTVANSDSVQKPGILPRSESPPTKTKSKKQKKWKRSPSPLVDFPGCATVPCTSDYCDGNTPSGTKFPKRPSSRTDSTDIPNDYTIGTLTPRRLSVAEQDGKCATVVTDKSNSVVKTHLSNSFSMESLLNKEPRKSEVIHPPQQYTVAQDLTKHSSPSSIPEDLTHPPTVVPPPVMYLPEIDSQEYASNRSTKGSVKHFDRNPVIIPLEQPPPPVSLPNGDGVYQQQLQNPPANLLRAASLNELAMLTLEQCDPEAARLMRSEVSRITSNLMTMQQYAVPNPQPDDAQISHIESPQMAAVSSATTPSHLSPPYMSSPHMSVPTPNPHPPPYVSPPHVIPNMIPSFVPGPNNSPPKKGNKSKAKLPSPNTAARVIPNIPNHNMQVAANIAHHNMQQANLPQPYILPDNMLMANMPHILVNQDNRDLQMAQMQQRANLPYGNIPLAQPYLNQISNVQNQYNMINEYMQNSQMNVHNEQLLRLAAESRMCMENAKQRNASKPNRRRPVYNHNKTLQRVASGAQVVRSPPFKKTKNLREASSPEISDGTYMDMDFQCYRRPATPKITLESKTTGSPCPVEITRVPIKSKTGKLDKVVNRLSNNNSTSSLNAVSENQSNCNLEVKKNVTYKSGTDSKCCLIEINTPVESRESLNKPIQVINVDNLHRTNFLADLRKSTEQVSPPDSTPQPIVEKLPKLRKRTKSDESGLSTSTKPNEQIHLQKRNSEPKLPQSTQRESIIHSVKSMPIISEPVRVENGHKPSVLKAPSKSIMEGIPLKQKIKKSIEQIFSVNAVNNKDSTVTPLTPAPMETAKVTQAIVPINSEPQNIPSKYSEQYPIVNNTRENVVVTAMKPNALVVAGTDLRKVSPNNKRHVGSQVDHMLNGHGEEKLQPSKQGIDRDVQYTLVAIPKVKPIAEVNIVNSKQPGEKVIPPVDPLKNKPVEAEFVRVESDIASEPVFTHKLKRRKAAKENIRAIRQEENIQLNMCEKVPEKPDNGRIVPESTAMENKTVVSKTNEPEVAIKPAVGLDMPLFILDTNSQNPKLPLETNLIQDSSANILDKQNDKPIQRSKLSKVEKKPRIQEKRIPQVEKQVVLQEVRKSVINTASTSEQPRPSKVDIKSTTHEPRKSKCAKQSVPLDLPKVGVVQSVIEKPHTLKNEQQSLIPELVVSKVVTTNQEPILSNIETSTDEQPPVPEQRNVKIDKKPVKNANSSNEKVQPVKPKLKLIDSLSDDVILPHKLRSGNDHVIRYNGEPKRKILKYRPVDDDTLGEAAAYKNESPVINQPKVVILNDVECGSDQDISAGVLRKKRRLSKSMLRVSFVEDDQIIPTVVKKESKTRTKIAQSLDEASKSIDRKVEKMQSSLDSYTDKKSAKVDLSEASVIDKKATIAVCTKEMAKSPKSDGKHKTNAKEKNPCELVHPAPASPKNKDLSKDSKQEVSIGYNKLSTKRVLDVNEKPKPKLKIKSIIRSPKQKYKFEEVVESTIDDWDTSPDDLIPLSQLTVKARVVGKKHSLDSNDQVVTNGESKKFKLKNSKREAIFTSQKMETFEAEPRTLRGKMQVSPEPEIKIKNADGKIEVAALTKANLEKHSDVLSCSPSRNADEWIGLTLLRDISVEHGDKADRLTELGKNDRSDPNKIGMSYEDIAGSPMFEDMCGIGCIQVDAEEREEPIPETGGKIKLKFTRETDNEYKVVQYNSDEEFPVKKTRSPRSRKSSTSLSRHSSELMNYESYPEQHERSGGRKGRKRLLSTMSKSDDKLCSELSDFQVYNESSYSPVTSADESDSEEKSFQNSTVLKNPLLLDLKSSSQSGNCLIMDSKELHKADPERKFSYRKRSIESNAGNELILDDHRTKGAERGQRKFSDESNSNVDDNGSIEMVNDMFLNVQFDHSTHVPISDDNILVLTDYDFTNIEMQMPKEQQRECRQQTALDDTAMKKHNQRDPCLAPTTDMDTSKQVNNSEFAIPTEYE